MALTPDEIDESLLFLCAVSREEGIPNTLHGSRDKALRVIRSVFEILDTPLLLNEKEIRIKRVAVLIQILHGMLQQGATSLIPPIASLLLEDTNFRHLCMLLFGELPTIGPDDLPTE